MYEEFAKVYDFLMQSYDYEAYTQYYLDLMDKYAIEKGSLLDFGAGTGTFTEILASFFSEVTAVDSSKDMLSVAKEKLWQKKNIELICADISGFQAKKKYDAVIASFDVMNYMHSYEMLRRTIFAAYSALKDNGIFLFDMSSIDRFRYLFGNNSYAMEDQKTFMTWQNKYDESRNMVSVRINVFRKEENGLYSRVDEKQNMRGFPPKELLSILTQCGFGFAECLNPLTMEEYNEELFRLQFVALKRET